MLRIATAIVVACATLASGTPACAQGAVTDHVLIISLDGLRPDALEEYGVAAFVRLLQTGSHSLDARTVYPSSTLPAHTSMLTGVEPGDHGVRWNRDRRESRGLVQVPTVFELAGKRALRTAMFFSKSKLRHLDRPGSVDEVVGPSEERDLWLASRTLGEAVDYLESETPNLMFVHIAEADYAGHMSGWMSRRYQLAVRQLESVVAMLLQAADGAFGTGEYTVLLTSDHGGQGTDHGTRDRLDVTIPWLAWGEGVRPSGEIDAEERIRVMDTAATALWLLGVPVPENWDGRPVVEAFDDTARLIAERAAAASDQSY